MLIRGAPKNESDYLKVDGKINKKLQNMGFSPLYYDGEFFYYEDDLEIVDFLERKGVRVKVES